MPTPKRDVKFKMKPRQEKEEHKKLKKLFGKRGRPAQY